MEPGENKKSKSKKILAIVLVIIALVFVLPTIINVVGLFFPVTFPDIFSRFSESIQKNSSMNSLVKTTTIYKPTVPETIPGSSVSKVISAKDGGNIKLTDSNGVETDLFFFPDGLEKDTKITVTLLKKFPLENYGPTLTPGVLIEPKDVKFKSPAMLTFTFPKNKKQSFLQSPLPGIKAANAQKREINPLTAEEMQKIQESLPPLVPLPIGFGANDNPGGGGIISSNDNTGSTGVVPSTTSQDGTSVTGPVASGGSYAPDNVDSNEAGNFIGQGHAEGSRKCDQNTANMINYARSADAKNDNITGFNANNASLSKCSDEIFEVMLEKCRNNRIEVRRKDFFLLMSLYRTVGNNSKIDEIKDLMNACTGRYSATGQQTFQGNGGVAISQVSAEVCGFIDDTWKGSYYLIIPGSETVSNDISFTLPANGGAVFQTHKGYASGVINTSIASSAITGYFDGKKNLHSIRTENDHLPGGDSFSVITL